jgi:predicted aminopeptidase
VKASAVVALSALLASTASCTSVAYVFQAAEGQCDISCRARPLEDVLRDEDTDPEVKALLAHVPAIKRFAEDNGLEPTPSYAEYVDLERDAAVYVVSACHPLAFEPMHWDFPIVGSVPYLGWFDLLDAKRFAADLAAEGWDVDLRGASAYSTLGWFDDPILSSMIDTGEGGLADLANTVLHESAHATLYVSSQSYFNESLANFVGDELTMAYLKKDQRVGAAQASAWREGERIGELRAERFHRAYLDLERLYSSDLGVEAKLAKKSQYLAELRAELSFGRPITNATLVGFKTYNTGDADFASLLSACGGDWRRFWSAVTTVDSSSFDREQEEDLTPLLAQLATRCRRDGDQRRVRSATATTTKPTVPANK